MWYYKSKITELEAVRIERDVRGIPVALAPVEYLNSKDTEKVVIQEQLKTSLKWLKLLVNLQ